MFDQVIADSDETHQRFIWVALAGLASYDILEREIRFVQESVIDGPTTEEPELLAKRILEMRIRVQLLRELKEAGESAKEKLK